MDNETRYFFLKMDKETKSFTTNSWQGQARRMEYDFIHRLMNFILTIGTNIPYRCLSGKLWYLQQSWVGNTIVYH